MAGWAFGVFLKSLDVNWEDICTNGKHKCAVSSDGLGKRVWTHKFDLDRESCVCFDDIRERHHENLVPFDASCDIAIIDVSRSKSVAVKDRLKLTRRLRGRCRSWRQRFVWSPVARADVSCVFDHRGTR